MKKISNLLIVMIVIIVAGYFTSCGEDFLTAESTNSKPYGTDSITEQSINGNLASAYHILLRDNYANGYNSIVFTSDIRSDDVFKGGEKIGDQRQFYNVSLFTCDPTQNIYGFWELFYRGVARCNETIANADKFIGAGTGDINLVKQYKAEALFLRAYFMHWMWLNWGNVPYPKALLTQETKFIAVQYTADDVYQRLLDDIKDCEDLGVLELKSKEIARVNLAAVYMLKAAIVMYQNDNSKYNEIAENMATIINSGIYDLMDDFDKMWEQDGEFCKENIFETNAASAGGTDWGTSASNPWGYGTNLPKYISPRDFKDPDGVFLNGWGFCPVRPYLYKLIGDPKESDGKDPFFEAADVRRLASINYWPLETYKPGGQDTRGYFLRKYAARDGYSVAGTADLNFCNNLRIYRFAETLLNYAELVGVLSASASGSLSAQACLDKVRTRAGGLASIPVNAANIELERHREFIGEGKRYWDLVRWGKAEQTLTESFIQPSADGSGAAATFSFSRTWSPAKSKYLPIPDEEVKARLGTSYEIKQNPY